MLTSAKRPGRKLSIPTTLVKIMCITSICRAACAAPVRSAATYRKGRCMCITLTPLGPVFHGRYLHSWNSAGAEKGLRWNYFAESFPKTYRSVLALAPSWLTSNRALKSALRGCGIHTPSYAGTHVVLLYCHFFSRSYLKSGSSLVHTALHSQSQRSRRPSPTKAERENVSDGNAELV